MRPPATARRPEAAPSPPAARTRPPPPPPPELLGAFGDGGADADAGAEELVGALQPRRDVDGIAIGGVVEEAVAAEIANHGWTGVNADPGDPEIHAFCLPALAKFLGPGIEVMRAGDGARRIVRLITGGVEENLDAIADDFRNRAFMREDHFRHSTDILVEHRAEHFGRRSFHQ